MAEIDERVVALQSRIFAAKLNITDVLEKAGVSRSTWQAWRKGSDPRRQTLANVSNALDAMIANPQQETTHGS